MKKELKASIQATMREFLENMNFVNVRIEEESMMSDSTVPTFNVEVSGDSRFLIGQHGDNLIALQHLMRLVVRKTHPEESINFVVDVNGYRKERNESLRETARGAARDAARDMRAVIMRQMSPYERRIIHTELAEDQSVVTESIGEGNDRKVVIKPSGLIDSN